jgi:hypothetical protein
MYCIAPLFDEWGVFRECEKLRSISSEQALCFLQSSSIVAFILSHRGQCSESDTEVYQLVTHHREVSANGRRFKRQFGRARVIVLA